MGDWPLPVSVLSGFVIGQSAVIIMQPEWRFVRDLCDSLWCFFMNYWDNMCGPQAVQEPAIIATVELMQRKAEMNYETKPKNRRDE